jgi:sugar lactone lactonase YvrE
MKGFVAEPVSETHHQLGEGPVWDAQRDRLLWIDIALGQVFEGRFANGVVVTTDHHDFPGTVGVVVPAADGQLLVATDVGLVEIGTDGSRRQVGQRLIPDGKSSRLNDGACDPAGRLLVGSLALDDREKEEVLYRLETDGTVTEVDTDLTLSNGLAWTADGNGYYRVDTIPGVIWYRPYDPETGQFGEREELLRIADETPSVVPDGLCVDVDGNLWIAIWGAGQVRCFSPSGDALAVVTVPAPHTSSVAFIGRDRDTLLITTARNELSHDQLTTFPDSGRLFTARVGTRGLPTTPWLGHPERLHQSP